MMLGLQDRGCHNINFVTPEHVVPQVLEALVVAVEQGLQVPLVYNTSAYDSLRSLELLDGVVDIYMPDFKFWDAELANRYTKVADYPEVARRVVREMYRQVGDLVVDERGLALRGVLVRHLVMPGGVAGTGEVMRWLSEEVSPNVYVNVMDQYHPDARVSGTRYEEIDRRITGAEFAEALRATRDAGVWRLDTREVV
jgi:putative pyruvate formate lyase activating enzyme